MSADGQVPKPEIQHVSDMLCVWAYVSHVRLEELTRRYGDRLRISLHFCPSFPMPAARSKPPGRHAAVSTAMRNM